MMKRILTASMTLCLLLIFTSSAWSLYIYDGELVDVGDVDTYLASATQEEVGGSAGDENELNWINTTLFDLGLISSYYTMSDFDKSDTDGGAGWLQAYSAPDVVAPCTFAYNLVTSDGERLFPDYFLVKTGNLNEVNAPDYRWFLFENNELLDWAVINLQEQGYSLLELGRISHVDTVGTAPVPEPATMLLLGSGLIGLAGFRKKFKK